MDIWVVVWPRCIIIRPMYGSYQTIAKKEENANTFLEKAQIKRQDAEYNGQELDEALETSKFLPTSKLLNVCGLFKTVWNNV